MATSAFEIHLPEDRTSPNSKFSLRDLMEAFEFENMGSIPPGMVGQWEAGLWDEEIAENLEKKRRGKPLTNPGPVNLD